MPALKCPSSSCPFLFDPTLVPPGALLTCPRCGMRFTLGPTRPGVNPPGVGAPPLNAPPMARDEPKPAAAQPAQQPASAEQPLPTIARVRPQTEPLEVGRRTLKLTAIMLGVMLLLGVVIGFIIVTQRPAESRGLNEFGSEYRVPDFNFSFAKAPPGWETDNAARTQLELNGPVYRHTVEPEAWVGLKVSDYGSSAPSRGELISKLLNTLNLGFEDVPSEAELQFQPLRWAGEEAQTTRLRLRQKATDLPIILDATMLSHRGIAYWFYSWTAQANYDSIADELDKLRDSFRLLGGRPNQGHLVTKKFPHRNRSGKYVLFSSDDIWREPPGLKGSDEDPRGDLYLKATLTKVAGKDLKPTAELLVMVLDTPGEANDVARAYLTERLKRNEAVLGKVQLQDISSENEITTPIPVTKWRLRRGTDQSFTSADKFIAYSAIQLGDQTIVAEASTAWSEREHWERKLVELVGSLQK